MNALGRKYVWHPSRTDEFKIVYFSDIHWFAKACAEKHVLAQRDAIRDDPNTFWIGGGDYAEFIGYQDAKRFDPDAVSERVKVKDLARLGKASYEAIRELFEPIKGKCLGLIEGNHEREYARRNQQSDLHGWLCTELGVSNMGYSCLFDLNFCRTARIKTAGLQDGPPPQRTCTSEAFRVFCHHGAGYAQTKGGKINRLSAFMLNFDADLYFMGHIHDELGLRMEPLAADATCTSIIHKTKLGVVSGGFMKTYEQGTTTYGEQKGYSPTTIGAAWVGIRPDGRKVWANV